MLPVVDLGVIGLSQFDFIFPMWRLPPDGFPAKSEARRLRGTANRLSLTYFQRFGRQEGFCMRGDSGGDVAASCWDLVSGLGLDGSPRVLAW